MDRKQQLRNVAFGGAWSEQIAGREAQAAAIAAVAAAAAKAGQVDPLNAPTLDALEILCARHPKGAMLRAAWMRAGRIDMAGPRVQELTRIARLLAAAISAR